ncbi:vgr related protein [Novosphingobium sp. 9]|uniref:vgr related protein n=1 Tax=Novosphingobium sp. 9 TaxID=2025349 RepID=UPI0021B52DDC|nr:vgr related protein [Novosphingobium sp. 9]
MSSPDPASTPRPLTQAERALAAPVFRGALDLDAARIVRRRWWPLQPRNVVMTPRGCIHIAPNAPFACDCFASQRLSLQALLIHELVHVWQHQQGVNLLLRRMPWSRYDYAIKPGWTLERYGIEQQAMIVEHVFTLRHGGRVPGAPPLETLESILPF